MLSLIAINFPEIKRMLWSQDHLHLVPISQLLLINVCSLLGMEHVGCELCGFRGKKLSTVNCYEYFEVCMRSSSYHYDKTAVCKKVIYTADCK